VNENLTDLDGYGAIKDRQRFRPYARSLFGSHAIFIDGVDFVADEVAIGRNYLHSGC
jgi:hypothetical protein